jgi:hypothetical protein
LVVADSGRHLAIRHAQRSTSLAECATKSMFISRFLSLKAEELPA